MFADVTRLESFQAKVSHKEEIKFNVQPNGMTVGCYMISAPDTFDSPEARECRGIVFDHEGAVAARPLHKFFNVGEKEFTHIENIDWSQVVRVMDKRDGSMIHTVRAQSIGAVGESYGPFGLSSEFGEHGFVLKSKKSFSSDVAIAATKWMLSRPNYLALCDEVTEHDYTAIFEYTAPTARIVLYYPEEGMTLLHVRDNTSGVYLTPEQLRSLADKHQVKLVDDVETFWVPETREFNFKALMDSVEHVEGVEGWIVQLASGEMVKVKTKWYLERHRAMTFLRVRDIARLTLSEGIDDLKSLLVAEGADIKEIEEIEKNVVGNIAHVILSVEGAVEDVKGQDVKTVALKYGPNGENHQHFGLIMAAFRGKTPNYVEWFERNVLDTYSLRQLNIMQSVAEPD